MIINNSSIEIIAWIIVLIIGLFFINKLWRKHETRTKRV